MDAMALLHSRVARVFYNVPDLISGVLGSQGMLHEAKTINHRYVVYCLHPTPNTYIQSNNKISEKRQNQSEDVSLSSVSIGNKRQKVT